MVDLKRLERAGNGCVWVFGTVPPFAFAVVMAIMAILGEPGSANRISGTLGAILFLVMTFTLMPLLGLTLPARKNQPVVLDLLEALQSRWGGDKTLPRFTFPLASPRLSTNLEGFPTEAFFQRVQHNGGTFLVAKVVEGVQAQFGTRLIGMGYRSNLWIMRPTPIKLVIMTRTRVSTLGAGLAGLEVVQSGDPRLDERFAVLSSAPAVALTLLSDRALWGEIEALLTSNVPYLGRLDFQGNMTIWMTVLTKSTTPESFERAARILLDLGRKLEEASRRHQAY